MHTGHGKLLMLVCYNIGSSLGAAPHVSCFSVSCKMSQNVAGLDSVAKDMQYILHMDTMLTTTFTLVAGPEY